MKQAQQNALKKGAAALGTAALVACTSLVYAKSPEEPFQDLRRWQNGRIQNTLAESTHEKLFFSSVAATARPEPAVPLRTFSLHIENPLDSLEANSAAGHSLDQLFAKAHDAAGADGLDNFFAGRVFSFVTAEYLSSFARIQSHELAHVRANKRQWGAAASSTEMPHIVSDYLALPVPTFHPGVHAEREQWAKSTDSVSALNQDEFNASQKKPQTVYDDISFLGEKLMKIWYLTGTQVRSSIEEGGERGDAVDYVELLRVHGVSTTKNELFVQAALAPALSLQTWHSMKAVGTYLSTGKRASEPAQLTIGKIKIQAPLLSIYYTPRGGFYDLSTTFDSEGSRPLDLSLGADADIIGGGKVNALRLGVRYNNLIGETGPFATRIDLFGAVNTPRDDLSVSGFSAGMRVTQPFGPVALFEKASYAKNDLMENKVKEKEDGPKLQFGVQATF